MNLLQKIGWGAVGTTAAVGGYGGFNALHTATELAAQTHTVAAANAVGSGWWTTFSGGATSALGGALHTAGGWAATGLQTLGAAAGTGLHALGTGAFALGTAAHGAVLGAATAGIGIGAATTLAGIAAVAAPVAVGVAAIWCLKKAWDFFHHKVDEAQAQAAAVQSPKEQVRNDDDLGYKQRLAKAQQRNHAQGGTDDDLTYQQRMALAQQRAQGMIQGQGQASGNYVPDMRQPVGAGQGKF